MPDKAQRHIAGKADARDKYHHQPDLARVQGVKGTEVLVGQYGQNDERKHGKLQHGRQVAPTEIKGHAVQFDLEVKHQRGNDDQHHRQSSMAMPDHRPQAVAHDHSGNGRSAGVCVCLPLMPVRGNDHPADDQQAACQYPWRADFF